MLPRNDSSLIAIEWLEGGRVRLIDQTRLPHEESYLETSDYNDLSQAIRQMKVRGAPLIGITAAYAMALACRQTVAAGEETFLSRLREAAAGGNQT